MIKVFSGTILPDYSYLPLLYPNIGFQEKQSLLFLGRAFKNFKNPIVELVKTPDEADFILLPHNYFQVKGEVSYLDGFRSVAKLSGKKLIVFAYGDSAEPMPFENAIVLRTSQYRSKKLSNEIIMPAYAEDLGANGTTVRKKGKKPVIGFCGWVEHKDKIARIKYDTKLAMSMVRYGSVSDARLQGLHFRRQAVRNLLTSAKVATNFVLRTSYSGHRKTIALSPEKARKEFVENMRDSDFVLAVKGDGNFSYRFFEALSMMRVPLLVDTECVLPLEESVRYDSFIAKVTLDDLSCIGERAADFFTSLPGPEFEQMQVRARDAFIKYLRIDRFFEIVFSDPGSLLRRAGYCLQKGV